MKVSIVGDKEVNKRLGGLKRYAVKVAQSPSAILVTQQTMNESLAVAKRVFAQPKNKPKYPLRWKSDRQRIAVIIKLKKEGNFPYKRTGNFDKSWGVSAKQNTVEIFNDARDPSTGKFIPHFLIGDFQQPFHADTGYVKRSEKIEMQIIKPLGGNIMRSAKQGIEASKHG